MTTESAPPAEPKPITTVSLMKDRRNWPIWLVVAACGSVFIGQSLFPYWLDDGAFSAQAMADGRCWTIFTSLFLHGGLMHIVSNMWAYLAFAPLVVARFGRGWKAVLPYHLLYLVCGLAGNAMFWLIHPHGDNPVVGASGAIYGIYAAAMRLDLFSNELWPIWSRRTRDAVWFFIWSNALVIAMFGGPQFLAFMQGQASSFSIPIAWETHLGPRIHRRLFPDRAHVRQGLERRLAGRDHHLRKSRLIISGQPPLTTKPVRVSVRRGGNYV